MANRTAKVYVRNAKGKYSKPTAKLNDLPEGSSYVLFWYEGKSRKSERIGRFADEAKIAIANREHAPRLAPTLSRAF